MTKKPRIYKGKSTVSSINGAGRTGQQHTEEWSSTTIMLHKQKLSPNELKTWMKDPKP